MQLTSNEIEERLIKAEESYHNKEYNRSISILKDIITKNPNYAPVYRKIGAILMRSETPQIALSYLNKAIELAPNDTDNLVALATYYGVQKEWEIALNIWDSILKIVGTDIVLYINKLKIYQEIGDTDLAIDTIHKILDIEPFHIDTLWLYAKILNKIDKKRESLTIYNKILTSIKSDVSYKLIEEWYTLSTDLHNFQETNNILKILSIKNRQNIHIKTLYAQSCELIMNFSESLIAYKEAYEMDKKNSDLNYNLASIYRKMNLQKESVQHLNIALDINPLHISAIHTLGSGITYSYGCENFKRLQYALAHISKLSKEEKIQLHFSAGKAYDDLGELNVSFEHYKLGGKLRSNSQDNISISFLKEQINFSKKVLTKDLIYEHSKKGVQDNKRMFIVGMPRSGSSLIEQVLSSNKNIYGAGELYYSLDALDHLELGNFTLKTDRYKYVFDNIDNPTIKERGEYYLDQLKKLSNSDTVYTIDKMPDNFKYLGFIQLILPNAIFIHSIRNPIEIALSAYRTLFINGHSWSDDLRTIGIYYRLYHDMMNYWKSILPKDKILDVRYEDMVSDIETQSKKIIDHIGVEWDDNCLEFHQNQRVVNTASALQVRKPIYTTSTNRWKKYKPYLKPLLDEIGDLVEDYENILTLSNQYQK